MEETIKLIKWMCFDIYITKDKKVLSLDLFPQRLYIINGKSGYNVNGYFRYIDWINKNSINIENFIEV